MPCVSRLSTKLSLFKITLDFKPEHTEKQDGVLAVEISELCQTLSLGKFWKLS